MKKVKLKDIEDYSSKIKKIFKKKKKMEKHWNKIN
jgi:hypothetical protein